MVPAKKSVTPNSKSNPPRIRCQSYAVFPPFIHQALPAIPNTNKSITPDVSRVLPTFLCVIVHDGGAREKSLLNGIML
jgi:hypothetical protein